MTTLTVHHLDSSRSHRVLWLLEELGLDYEIVSYRRDPKTLLAPASLRAVHPLGKSPVVTDGDLTLAESGAILSYLVEHQGEGRLRPEADTPERLRYDYWMHYAEGSAMPPLLLALVFSRLKVEPLPFFVRPIARKIADKAMTTFIGPQLALHFDFMEGELGKSTWFCGEDFTAADIQMSYPIESAESRAGLTASRPKLTAYLERIRDRPAYQRARERGGPQAPLS